MRQVLQKLGRPSLRWKTATPFLATGLVPLLLCCGLIVLQARAHEASQERELALHRRTVLVDSLNASFDQWQKELLTAASDKALTDWYREPTNHDALRSQIDAMQIEVHTLYPKLVDEGCFIDAGGEELSRQVLGQAAPVSELSPDESDNTFFHSTLALGPGQVLQTVPYISGDSNRWVIGNATQVVVDGRARAMLHFETNVDALRT